jgi:hypothetical protein
MEIIELPGRRLTLFSFDVFDCNHRLNKCGLIFSLDECSHGSLQRAANVLARARRRASACRATSLSLSANEETDVVAMCADVQRAKRGTSHRWEGGGNGPG